jgi:preprotein translocase subunit Sec61beta
MSDKVKESMPVSTAGLTRYFEDFKPTIQIKPEHVVIATATLIGFEIFLKFFPIL